MVEQIRIDMKTIRIISLLISGMGVFWLLYALITWNSDPLWSGLTFLFLGITGYKHPEYISNV